MSRAIIRTTWVASTVLLAGFTAAIAQDDFKCDGQGSLADCYTAFFAQGMSEEEAKPKVEEKAAAAAGPGINPSLLEFLPSFLGNLGIDGLSDSNGNLTFDRVIAIGDSWRVGVGVTAFADPEVFEPLKKALPEAIRDERVKTLDEEIGDFDKVDFRLAISREDAKGERRFGRDADDYSDLFSIWKQGIRDAAGQTMAVSMAVSGTPFNQWVRGGDVDQAMDDFGGDKFLTAGLSELEAKLGKERCDKLEQGIIEAAKGTKALLADVDKVIVDIDKAIGQIDDLIANQPQLYLKVDYRQREDTTGPEELSGKFVYEMGMSGNVNDFISWAKNHPNQCTATASGYPDYACMVKYLNQKPKAADNGNRLAVSVEYASADAIDFQLPEDDFTFKVDETEKWIGALSYGRYFPKFSFLSLAGEDGSGVEDGTRFELEASYEDVSGDPMRQSRFLATATFSQVMAKKTLFSISLVYANKPEYLGEVDEEVSARFGIKWKRNPQS